MATKTRRTSISMSISTLDDLDYCARNLGVTRSAFVNELLESPLSNIRDILEHVLPAVPEGSDVPIRRTSTEVHAFLKQFLSGLNDNLTALDSQLSTLEGISHDSSKH